MKWLYFQRVEMSVTVNPFPLVRTSCAFVYGTQGGLSKSNQRKWGEACCCFSVQQPVLLGYNLDLRYSCNTDDDNKNTPHIIKWVKENSTKDTVKSLCILMVQEGISGFKSRSGEEVRENSIEFLLTLGCSVYETLQMPWQVEMCIFLSYCDSPEMQMLSMLQLFWLWRIVLFPVFGSCGLWLPVSQGMLLGRDKGEWLGAHLGGWKTILLNLPGQWVSISIAPGTWNLSHSEKRGPPAPQGARSDLRGNESSGQGSCPRIQPLILPLRGWSETQKSLWGDAGWVPKETQPQKTRQKSKLVVSRWVTTRWLTKGDL